MAAAALACWILLVRLFVLVWRMYYGHDYKEPKSIQDYLDWRNKRIEQLDHAGFAESHAVSEDEMLEYLVEDYALAADSNRRINLEVQGIMTRASRAVLWITLILVVQSVLFIVLVTV